MNGEQKREKKTLLGALIETVREENVRRRQERGALTIDIGVFLIAFFFAGRHIAFGSYPLAASLVAVMPTRVWIALLGAVCGSLSLGKAGVIHAIIVMIIFLLRIIISSGASNGEEGRLLFSEPLIMRLCAAVIGAFVGAGYEMLFAGFLFSSVLFGVTGVGLTLIFALVFSGLFSLELSAAAFLFGERTLFMKKEAKTDKRLIFFQISFAISALLLSLSLIKYDYFGISGAYLFSVALTLFISKRFGVWRGAVIGFASSLGISALYSPGFAILGAVSGLLYPYGAGYAIVGSGIAFCAWAVYSGGMTGLLSVLIEFLVGAALIYRAVGRAHTEKAEQISESIMKSAEEMVGASWLSRKRSGERVASLGAALLSASDRIEEISKVDTLADYAEYERVCREVLEKEKTPIKEENIVKITTKLYKKEKITPKEAAELSISEELLDILNSTLARYELGLYSRRRVGSAAEQYTAISKMISDSLRSEREAEMVNPSLTEAASEVFSARGFPEGCIKVFGEERISVVAAGHDPDGRLITSPELKRDLEEALGYKLGSYEYFRRGEMALFTASAAPRFSVEYSSRSRSAVTAEPSGDSAKFFFGDFHFFAVLSDGMGTGRDAGLSASFVSSYLSDMLSSEVSVLDAVSSLSHLLRQREAESSATLDLFSFDLLSGEAVFTKCGAASSYVKRGRSIFRVRSESAPIGLIPTLDAEKIRVEVKVGDTVIMLSDGVSASAADAAWLLSFLSKEDLTTAEDYAERILSLAEKNSRSRDDMTVCVVQISAK